MGATVAAKNRKVRQENLREMLSKQKHLEQALENLKKIEDLGSKLESNEIMRLKIATEQRIKLIDFYLPKLKATELTGEDGKDLIPATITLKYE